MVSVEEDLGSNQLQRLVDLLTVHECEKLLMTFSNIEEHSFDQFKRLPEEMNQFSQPSHLPGDTGIEMMWLNF